MAAALRQRRLPHRDYPRLQRVRGIDGVIVSAAARVVRQAVRRPASFMARESGEHDFRRRIYREEGRRQQLWVATVTGNIVDVDRRRAIAVRAIYRAEQLATLVDLQRFPRIEHRSRLQ